MNNDQIQSPIRNVLMGLLGLAVGAGYIPADIVPELASALAAIGIIIWGIVTKTNAATVKKAAAIVTIDASTQRSVGIDNPVKPTT
jgi:hypothetical protein